MVYDMSEMFQGDFLNQFRMALVELGVSLEGARRLNHAEVVTRACDELNSDGQVLIREATGYRERRQAAQISDCAEWIGK